MEEGRAKRKLGLQRRKRVGEAPFRVAPQWASEPHVAGKERTFVED